VPFKTASTPHKDALHPDVTPQTSHQVMIVNAANVVLKLSRPSKTLLIETCFGQRLSW
jgi:hypothetical protein